jgi:hypothetical protein
MAKAVRPGEGAFDHPAAREGLKAFRLGLFLDYLQGELILVLQRLRQLMLATHRGPDVVRREH